MVVCNSRNVGAAVLIAVAAVGWCRMRAGGAEVEAEAGLVIEVRGIYGGVPTQILDRGRSLSDYGINAVWVGSGGLTREGIVLLRRQGAKVFAEFNTMHDAAYLKDHPHAAPVGSDGKPCPPPDGWQGVCPTHPGYRAARMTAFRKALRDFEIDGIWLDYHHAHANWEQAEPALPDTCFCVRCLARFTRETGVDLPDRPTPELARWLLGPHREEWVNWRCGVFTDWVREFRAIRDEVRPGALLGTFHCPWSEDERGGALRSKLAIDLRAQAKYARRIQPDAVSCPVRSRRRPGLDRAAGRLARATPRGRGQARRADEDLADRAVVRLGRAGPGGAGGRSDRPGDAPARDRGDCLRLGPSLAGLGQGGAAGPRVSFTAPVRVCRGRGQGRDGRMRATRIDSLGRLASTQEAPCAATGSGGEVSARGRPGKWARGRGRPARGRLNRRHWP